MSTPLTSSIHTLRGQRVMLDADLAMLYGVETKRLNEQVRRNAGRFPSDFVFQLTAEEVAGLRSQIATSTKHGGRRYLPYAFTEHGAVMLASVLNSPTAIEASVQVVRAFVEMRRLLVAHEELSRRLGGLEQRLDVHDQQLDAVFDTIRMLLDHPADARKPMGFRLEEG